MNDPLAFGDVVSGSNDILPANAAARYTGGFPQARARG